MLRHCLTEAPLLVIQLPFLELEVVVTRKGGMEPEANSAAVRGSSITFGVPGGKHSELFVPRKHSELLFEKKQLIPELRQTLLS